MSDATPRWRAIAALLFGACVIGVSPILFRLADTGPAAAAFWRLFFAVPLLLAMTWRTEGGPGRPTGLGAIAGVMFAGDLIFWHYGIQLTTVAKATVLSNLTPVVVTLFAWIFLRERPRLQFLAAVALAVGGAWTMALAKGSGAAGINEPLGDLLSAATAFWYALYMLAIGAGRRTTSAGRLMVWSSIVGAPIMLVAALMLGEQILPLSLGGWAACVGLGLTHVFGQGAIAWALGRLPTSTASVVVLVQPIVAGLLGWLLFAEALGPLQGLGAAIALSGVVLAQWATRPRAQPSTPNT